MHSSSPQRADLLIKAQRVGGARLTARRLLVRLADPAVESPPTGAAVHLNAGYSRGQEVAGVVQKCSEHDGYGDTPAENGSEPLSVAIVNY